MDKLDQQVSEATKETGRALLRYAHATWKPQHDPTLVRLLMAETLLYLYVGAIAVFSASYSPEKQTEIWVMFQERADELHERVMDGDTEVLRLYDA